MNARACRADTVRAFKKNGDIAIKFIKLKGTMTKVMNLIDRIDTIRANSVSDKEFEQTWGESLDSKVKKSMDKWDELLAQAKTAIESK